MAKMAAFPHDMSIDNEYLPIKSGETFELGALVLLDSNEEVVECGADPAVVYGIALNRAGAEPHPTSVIVAKATPDRRFWIAGDNAPVAGDLNQSYGAAEDADGIWHLDGTETGSPVFYVHRIDTERSLYLVEILAAVRQVIPDDDGS